MKKILLILFTVILFFIVSAEASENTVTVTNYSMNNGFISIDVENSTDSDTEFMLTIIKNDSGFLMKNRLFAMRQYAALAGESVSFKCEIPSERDGIGTAGEYIITIKDLQGNSWTKNFEYVDSKKIDAFLSELKEAASAVTDSKEAYNSLLPIAESDNGEDVLLFLGIDYTTFCNEKASIKHDTMNQLYNSEIQSMTVDNFVESFKAAYGLSVYNAGERSRGFKNFSVTYNDSETDPKLVESAIKNMADKYDKIEECKSDFIVSYGIQTINGANINNVKNCLTVFCDETGLLTEETDKINSLSKVKQTAVYEKMEIAIDKTKLGKVSDLKKLLDDAYSKTKEKNGGEGSSGSSSNRVSSSGKVSASSIVIPTLNTKPNVNTDIIIFNDLPKTHWANESINWLYNAGAVQGNGNGCFEPDKLITREEFVKMLVILDKCDVSGCDTTFEDALSGAWYRPYVGAAVRDGLVIGINEKNFGIGQTVSRQDMAVMISRTVQNGKIKLNTVREYDEFSDNESIAEYAKEAVKQLYIAGILSGTGDNKFEARRSATRAEAAKILFEVFNKGV